MLRGCILLAVTAAAFGLAGPASADGGPIVDPGNGHGTIGTGIWQPPTPGGDGPGTGTGQGPGGTSGGQKCDYILDYSNPASHPGEYPGLHDPSHTDDKGAYYYYSCPDGTTGFVWVPTGAAPGGQVPIVTPGQLALYIYNRLQLPKPAVGINPPDDDPARFQLVNFPTWWWVTNFAPLQQRTALGAVWAEVTATPVYSTFDGGEGDAARCAGAGMAWHSGLPGDFRGACTYTYRRASEHVTATVAVTWRVAWVGSGGTGGQFDPMQMATGLPLTVYERQAVNVPYGS